MFNLHFMKVSTEIDNNFGYEKITQLVDNIPLRTLYQEYVLRGSLLLISSCYNLLMEFFKIYFRLLVMLRKENSMIDLVTRQRGNNKNHLTDSIVLLVMDFSGNLILILMDLIKENLIYKNLT